MNLFLANDVILALNVLGNVEMQCAFLTHLAREHNKPCPILPPDTHKAAIDGVKKLFSVCGLGQLPERLQCSLIRLENTKAVMDVSAVGNELTNIREAISSECSNYRFLRVEPERSTSINNSAILGSKVPQAFPSAVQDIIEAGNCLAAECNTAAVFHLMRSVEWGIRAFAFHLGMRRVRNKIKKSGRILYAPIEYSEWEKIIDGLQDRVDKKIDKLKRGTNKQECQQFYYPALQDIRAIRDAWRNHTMHTRSEYDHSDADYILSHVRRLMASLATRIKEV